MERTGESVLVRSNKQKKNSEDRKTHKGKYGCKHWYGMHTVERFEGGENPE